jgi:hypothetical protein
MVTQISIKTLIISSNIDTEVHFVKIKAMVIFYLSGHCDLDLVEMETRKNSLLTQSEHKCKCRIGTHSDRTIY